MQVLNKKTYLVYPYTSEKSTQSLEFTRGSMNPVNVKLNGVIIPGVHFNSLSVWEMDEAPSADVSQTFDTADQMYAYLESIGIQKADILKTFQFLPYHGSTAEGWLSSNTYKTQWDAMGLFEQYMDTPFLTVKDTSQMLQGQMRNMWWGYFHGIASRSVGSTKYVWGDGYISYFNTEQPADPTDQLVGVETHPAWPPIIASGYVGSSNYEIGPNYAGISSNEQRLGSGIAIPLLFKAPIPDHEDDHYYGIICFGYRHASSGVVDKYFVNYKAFGTIASTSQSFYNYTRYLPAEQSAAWEGAKNTALAIDRFFEDATLVEDSPWVDDGDEITGDGDNPYEDHEITEVQGGDGNFTGATDTTDAATSHTSSSTIATSGGIVLYHLSTGELALYQATLYKYLKARRESVVLSTVYQSLYDALKGGMLNLFAVPFDVSSYNLDDLPIDFGVGNVGVVTASGSITDLNPTYEQVTPLKANYVKLADITLPTVDRYYGSFLDYEPYTTFKIYIPYYGDTQIEASKVYGHTLTLSYRVDLTNGSFLCILMSDGFQVGTFTGNCGYKIQVVQNDIGTVAQEMAKGIAKTAAALIAGPAGAAAASVDMQAHVPSHVDIIGQGIGGSLGWLGSQFPYVTRTRAIGSVPKSYGKLHGLPLRMTSKLTAANLEGKHIRVEAAHVRCSGTLEERREIEEKLREGVVV